MVDYTAKDTIKQKADYTKAGPQQYWEAIGTSAGPIPKTPSIQIVPTLGSKVHK